MRALPTPEDYLYNLEATNHSEAKRLWREQIKDHWNHTCAYCGSKENITLDHVKPKALGGTDRSENIVCACHKCNQDKGHSPLEEWYQSQYFFSHEKYESINAWTHSSLPKESPNYRHIMKRMNICYGIHK